MARRGPLITAAVVTVLIVVLIGANTLVARRPAAPAVVAPVAAPATVAAAPSTTPPSALQAVFAGRSSGNEVAVAIAVDGSRVAAYVCDGKRIEAWLQGSLTGGTITLTGRNGAGLTGTVSGTALFGTVSAGAAGSWPFSAQQSSPPTGVYQYRKEIRGLATRIGWAVLPDGTQLGVADSGTARAAAPRLDPASGAFTLEGASYTAAPVAGTDTVVGP